MRNINWSEKGYLAVQLAMIGLFLLALHATSFVMVSPGAPFAKQIAWHNFGGKPGTPQDILFGQGIGWDPQDR